MGQQARVRAMEWWEFVAHDMAPPAGAVGRLPNGQVVFVPYLLPGEKALIRLVKITSRWAMGECVKLVEPHPQRISPRCPVFGTCGGCDYQMLPYESQWALKWRTWQAKWHPLKTFCPEVNPVGVLNPNPWTYRRRIQLRLVQGQPCLNRKQSLELVPISRCELMDEALNEALTALTQRQWVLPDGSYRLYSPRVTEDFPGEEPWWDSQAQASWRSSYGPVWAFRAPQGPFVQADGEMNQYLRQLIADVCAQGGWREVLDLYAGSGNLSLGLVRLNPQFQRITGVEIHPKANSLARFRARLLAQQGYSVGVEWFETSAESFVKKQPLVSNPHQVVLLDPPRQGLSSGVLRWLLQEGHKGGLLYVSCYPDTWIRDARLLFQNWRLKDVWVLDMYPQTFHLELVSVWLPL